MLLLTGTKPSTAFGDTAAIPGGLARISAVIPLKFDGWVPPSAADRLDSPVQPGAHRVRILLELTSVDAAGLSFDAESVPATLVFEIPNQAIALVLDGPQGARLSLGTGHHVAPRKYSPKLGVSVYLTRGYPRPSASGHHECIPPMEVVMTTGFDTRVQPTATTMAHLNVHVFGNLSVRRGSTVLHAHQLGGPKPRQIFEILLVNLGLPVSKDRLIELLWGANAPVEALPTLESYVSVLRRHLQPGAGKFGPLQTTTGGYVLDRDLVDVDLDQFDVLLQRAQKTLPGLAYPLLLRALDLAAAPLLGDELIPAWASEARDLHAARLTSARILASETAAALHRIDDALDFANLALIDEPLNERAWTALILSLEMSGRHAEGLQAYDRCRRAMQNELGCAPGAILRAAQLRLLHATADGDGDLADVLSALLTLHDQLRASRARGTTSRLATTTHPRPELVADSLREATDVVTSFLRRAVAHV
ncbi:BTAD domain-containing putative transcriptional regulator [Cryobacterium sp. Y82]|uniref:AfsR/SARP family transcriptional regulator n=1 Tax=Cryobacterium sp. Y82 TaxID=2045017 RepID=UPI001E348E64|nr:BTAD domain-containing putative transcriptional regulator [Cryobacterium sp. Y82]